MFDREKQIVIDRYCKAIFHETDKISVSNLFNLNLPDSIKHYISKEIEIRVEHEFNEIKKFSKFDFNHPSVKPLVEELKVLLKFTKELDENELSLLLKFALDLNMDYLLKPCDTLKTFVFRYEEFQTVGVIKERLKFITKYEYFPILINEYFNRTGITKIHRDNFVDLLYKIEKEYTKDFTIVDHYEIFSQFKSFLMELNLFINDYPEYEAFLIHLKDKNHSDIAKFLEERKEHFKSSGENIKSYLQFLLQSVSKDVVKEFKVEAEQSLDSFTSEQLMVTGLEKLSSGINEKSNEIDSNLKGEISNQDLRQKEVFASSEKIEQKISTERNELYEKLKSGQPERSQKILDRNLDGLMPNRLKKKIVRKIFDGNEMMFNEFMSSINKVKNWDEASFLLTELFDKKNIQPFSKWAIKFTEFLYENIK